MNIRIQVIILNFQQQVNQTLPDRIIVFRDGVGDGQMSTVVEFEIPQLKSCLASFGNNHTHTCTYDNGNILLYIIALFV